MQDRLSSGLPDLDRALGGGFLPGSLVMLLGATGIGKTQLGTHFSHAGLAAEGQSGAIIDLSSRGDSQNHSGYSQRMFGKLLDADDPSRESASDIFHGPRPSDIIRFLGYGGRRVQRSQLDADQWHAWQAELNRRSPQLFRFVYSHLVHGTRRFVLDGIEPPGGADDSLQLDLLELVYHRMLRQESDWLAREVLRESFRRHAAEVERYAYNHREATAMSLITTKYTMLEQLMHEPLSDGDLVVGANTVILMGRRPDGDRLGRGLYIAKHRGSYAEERIIPFDIIDTGLVFEPST